MSEQDEWQALNQSCRSLAFCTWSADGAGALDTRTGEYHHCPAMTAGEPAVKVIEYVLLSFPISKGRRNMRLPVIKIHGPAEKTGQDSRCIRPSTFNSTGRPATRLEQRG